MSDDADCLMVVLLRAGATPRPSREQWQYQTGDPEAKCFRSSDLTRSRERPRWIGDEMQDGVTRS
jgi:hypothetical protein